MKRKSDMLDLSTLDERQLRAVNRAVEPANTVVSFRFRASKIRKWKEAATQQLGDRKFNRWAELAFDEAADKGKK